MSRFPPDVMDAIAGKVFFVCYTFGTTDDFSTEKWFQAYKSGLTLSWYANTSLLKPVNEWKYSPDMGHLEQQTTGIRFVTESDIAIPWELEQKIRGDGHDLEPYGRKYGVWADKVFNLDHVNGNLIKDTFKSFYKKSNAEVRGGGEVVYRNGLPAEFNPSFVELYKPGPWEQTLDHLVGEAKDYIDALLSEIRKKQKGYYGWMCSNGPLTGALPYLSATEPKKRVAQIIVGSLWDKVLGR